MKQKIQVDIVLTENSGCALTLDNILKIVAIFFRIKAGIHVLIMVETVSLFLKKNADKLQQDLQQHLKSAEEWSGRIHLIFLNEINTKVFCDHILKGREFPANVVIICALNTSEITENNEKSRNVNKYYINDLDKEMGYIWLVVRALKK
ncbi:hypothetical protein RFI_19247 [Reticulomyxa filosa]|uniref:Uncharacterized protein n=1 Tax=Reticulomyxa filosa TaxID=46433 RepID=X6MVM5_RETFI|nr:hypothetical protein RFI_19247 [Reticulomyxa filosa]|eukprot:ETO18048.1 hypothetical protein RFI_19247 [Reticulomyxa filosa]